MGKRRAELNDLEHLDRSLKWTPEALEADHQSATGSLDPSNQCQNSIPHIPQSSTDPKLPTIQCP